MKLSDKTAKALQVIRDHEITAPAQFAKLLWPDAEGWKRSSKVGRNSSGSAKGTGMRLGGGAYLGKLRKRKLIGFTYGLNFNKKYYLTEEGRTALAEWEQANVKTDDADGDPGRASP